MILQAVGKFCQGRFNQDTFAFEEVAQGATSITLNIIEQL